MRIQVDVQDVDMQMVNWTYFAHRSLSQCNARDWGVWIIGFEEKQGQVQGLSYREFDDDKK